ncbi:MAG: ATP-binding protein [Rickettsiales bacterium]|jgi:predicted ATPase|nr:ATP-binding protein [Rickettsiales bacterium]
MEIKLNNVGAINNASVNLTGLSVIAGPNGSGKSTVGKTAYAIIKAINDKDNIIKQIMIDDANDICRSVFFTIQNSISNTKIAAGDAELTGNDTKILLENFNYGTFVSDLFQLINSDDLGAAKNMVQSRIKMIDSFSNFVEDKAKTMARNSLSLLIEKFNKQNKENNISQSLVFMYEKIFKWQVNNLVSHEKSEISFGDLLTYSVSNNANTLSFSDRLKIGNFDPSVDQRIFPKVTFIETPLLLQLENHTDKDGVIPFYWKDLLNKLKPRESVDVIPCSYNEIYEKITNILGGNFEYNIERRRFEFIKNNFNDEANLFVNNMASGEKMLGIFQQMAKLGLFGPDHLLILDEPENHLHPQWQISLAEVLVNLAAAGCPILVASHSPDFIQALKFFTDKKQFKGTRFYLADEKTKSFHDKTDKVYEIFNNLSKPMNDIFKSMISKHHKESKSINNNDN